MRATRYLAPRPAAGAAPGMAGLAGPAGTVPAGAAMATLMAVAARTAWTIRAIALGYIVVQVLIWHSFFAARPERLAGPAVAVLAAAAVVARLRWSRPGWRLAALDTAVVAALALGAWWCVPPMMQGDTSSWLYIAVVSQLVVPAWFAPAAVFVPLTLVSAAAFWAGTVRAAPVLPGAASPAAAAANVLATAVVARCALWLLSRRARAADTALARADAESRAEFVALSQTTERREHERLLHDTVLNTLTALGRAPAVRPSGLLAAGAPEPAVLDPVAAAARCQHDVALIEHALGVAGDESPPSGLLAAIAAVAAEMRSRGLTVHAGASPADAPIPEVPGAVSTALAYAVREALANVAAHAGTAEAWVEVGPVAGPAAGPAGVQVAVRDHGTGFDIAAVDPARLGLRRSIVERVADWGGQAAVRSAPGVGTVVILRWLPPAPASGPAAASGPDATAATSGPAATPDSAAAADPARAARAGAPRPAAAPLPGGPPW
jgi:signal transduction histidine kinase